MTDETKKRLMDIAEAISNIDYHLGGKRNFNEFVENITIRRAIEREFEIIGEATNKILKENSAFPLIAAKKIISLRNRVIHAYDTVDETIIWKIIQKDLPILEKEVNELLSER